jgi:hypothetical protein
MASHAITPSWTGWAEVPRLFEKANAQRAAPKAVSVTPPTDLNKSGWANIARHRMGLALNLKAGWDCGESPQISRSLGFKAMSYLEFALASQPNATAPFIVPRADGGLQLEWHTKTVEIEIYFEPDGEVSGWATDRGTGYEIEFADDNTLPALVRWAPRLVSERHDLGKQRVPEDVAGE